MVLFFVNVTILIVDDNAAMREAIKSTVCSETDTIIERADGNEALEAYTQHRPDYVLMDIRMKQTDGITATAQILAFDPGAKVIIVTDFGSLSFRHAAEKAGAIGFVLKEQLPDLRRILRR
jgi:DNA-binding NarL/FixJ family response regulator